MKFELKKHIIITGHYGSGKTNVAVSLCLHLSKLGKKCALVDIDTVNPYFRAADAAAKLEKAGVKLIASLFANTNADIPSLPAEINMVFDKRFDHAVFDVGGDDSGAFALGGLSERIKNQGYTMLYVINAYRPLTTQSKDAAEILREIEIAARLKAAGIINNSNLGKDSDKQTVTDSLKYADDVSKALGLPVVYTTAVRALVSDLQLDNLFEITLHTNAQKLFEE